MKKINKSKKIILVILIILFIVAAFFIIYTNSLKNDIKSAKDYIEDDIINENNKFEVPSDEKKEDEKQETKILYSSERIDKVKKLKNTNSDIVGWLEIPDTNISYPVLQGIDNDYYMRRNYKKKYTINGSLFLDAKYNWNEPNENLLIYGHNNRGSKEMFVELLKYEDEKFYKEHPIVRFTTETEDAIYEIISVFKSRVYYKRETDIFRYYYFIDAENEEEFNNYISESKKASLYDIQATANYGDSLITLSTCEYSQKDGRFVVVARKQN